MMIQGRKLSVGCSTIIVFFCCFLGGCSPRSNTEATPNDKESIVTLDDIEINDVQDCTKEEPKYDSEGVTRQDELISKLYSITAKELEMERICTTLLSDYKITDIQSEETNGTVIIDVDESSLLVNKGMIEFSRNADADKIATLLFGYFWEDSNMLGFDLTHEAEETAKRNDTSVLTEKLAQMLQMDNNEELIVVRAVNMDMMDLQDYEAMLVEYEIEEDTVEEWTFEQYVALEYEVVKEGLPLMGINEPNQHYYIDVIGAQATYLRVIVGVDENDSYNADNNGPILYLSLRGLVEADSYEEVALLTEQEAIDIVQETESQLYSETKWVFQSAKLEYVSVPDWNANVFEPENLVPYWCVIGTEGEDAVATRINAVTGGDLAYAE